MPNCVSCKTQSNCSKCADGYGITQVGKCEACGDLIENCLNCTSYDACLTCKMDYDLTGNECRKPDDSGSNLIIILVSAGGGLVLITAVGTSSFI